MLSAPYNSLTLFLQRAKRLYFTLRPLKLRQFVFLIVRRAIRLPYRPPRHAVSINPQFSLSSPAGSHHAPFKDQRFHFLNTQSPFYVSDVQWQPPHMSKLWRYNLHYFDYLIDCTDTKQSKNNLPGASKDFLIQNWISRNPYPSEDAWEPYPVSLRIINWIKYFSLDKKNAVPDNWITSLYQQGHFLTRHIEWHIEANHLLKNLIALVIWSHFFNTPYALHWQKRSCVLLMETCREQFGVDGGHYERSPMYHFILLQHLLDAYNCLKNSTGKAPNGLHTLLSQALNFAHTICKPNGQLPLIKDSAYGIAPELAYLEYYAQQMGITAKNPGDTTQRITFLKETGYYIYKHQLDYILFDVGAITPSYQPGHAHCDALHLEVHWNGRDIFTDSGVFNYVDSPERRTARSTRAHNTLMINSIEQHDIWGAFRVAQRGESGTLRQDGLNCSADFTPFNSPNGHLRHKRAINIAPNADIHIMDSVHGVGRANIEIFWNLSPGLTPLLVGSNIHIHDENNLLVCVMKLQHNQVKTTLTQSDYFPEFGKRCVRHAVAMQVASALLPVHIAYELQKP